MSDGRRHRRNRQGTPVHEVDAALIAEYRRAMQRRGVRPSSVDAIERKLWLLAEHTWPTSLVDVDAETIERWLDGRVLVPRTRYSYLSHVHGFYEWAVRHGHTATDPTLHIARPRLPRHLPRPLSDHDLDTALREAPATIRAMLVLAAFQGLRCAEIAGLQREQILDRHDPAVLIVRHGAKGGHERVLPLHEATMPALRAHGLPRAGFVFTRDGTTDPLAAHAVSKRINRYMRYLGLDATAHQLRHWFGTKIYAASSDLLVTQALMGHASPTTTAGYAAFSNARAIDAVSALAVPKGADRQLPHSR